MGIDEYGYDDSSVRFPILFRSLSDIAIAELLQSQFLFGRKFARNATVVLKKPQSTETSTVALAQHLRGLLKLGLTGARKRGHQQAQQRGDATGGAASEFM